ncbi:hypothetical protein B0H12DRAFT_1261636 [Mycena haematopus]|nr:hypothetical protein B0H12DRAFT_1261636 [Mycena haematopus]
MHLFASILGAVALAGAARAQPSGYNIEVYTEPSCSGSPGGVGSGLSCNNCYSFTSAFGAVNLEPGFPSDWLWYGFTNNNCNPAKASEDLGAFTGPGCFVPTNSKAFGSIFLKCNGNPGFN